MSGFLPSPASEATMSRRYVQSLRHRADQSGMLLAAANVPLTFQRTLMPRPTMDQAIVTGLSIAHEPRPGRPRAGEHPGHRAGRAPAQSNGARTTSAGAERRWPSTPSRSAPGSRCSAGSASATASRCRGPRSAPVASGSRRRGPPARSSAGCRKPSARSEGAKPNTVPVVVPGVRRPGGPLQLRIGGPRSSTRICRPTAPWSRR